MKSQITSYAEKPLKRSAKIPWDFVDRKFFSAQSEVELQREILLKDIGIYSGSQKELASKRGKHVAQILCRDP